MRISDWSSDVCSSDLVNAFRHDPPISGALLMLPFLRRLRERLGPQGYADAADELAPWLTDWRGRVTGKALAMVSPASLEEVRFVVQAAAQEGVRSDEHTSELQSLMRNSYAVFCLKNKKHLRN